MAASALALMPSFSTSKATVGASSCRKKGKRGCVGGEPFSHVGKRKAGLCGKGAFPTCREREGGAVWEGSLSHLFLCQCEILDGHVLGEGIRFLLPEVGKHVLLCFGEGRLLLLFDSSEGGLLEVGECGLGLRFEAGQKRMGRGWRGGRKWGIGMGWGL